MFAQSFRHDDVDKADDGRDFRVLHGSCFVQVKVLAQRQELNFGLISGPIDNVENLRPGIMLFQSLQNLRA